MNNQMQPKKLAGTLLVSVLLSSSALAAPETLDWFYAGSADVLSYDMPEVKAEPVPIPIPLEWKCHAVRPSCVGLQAYFVGMSERGKLNLGRLGGDEALAGLNLRVHPLP